MADYSIGKGIERYSTFEYGGENFQQSLCLEASPNDS